MTPVLCIKALRIMAGEEPDAAFQLDVPALALDPGDCIAVTGPSGCGKSTFLEVLGLLRRPANVDTFLVRAQSSSDMLDLGVSDDCSHLRQGLIGYVPQMGGVLPFLTARAQIEASLHLAGVAGSKDAAARLARLADALDLAQHLGKRRSELSGGQRKRVALLVGLSVPRRLLIADEPTAGLDEQNAGRVMDALVTVAKEESTAVVIATHDVDAATRAGFSIATIESGILSAASASAEHRKHG